MTLEIGDRVVVTDRYTLDAMVIGWQGDTPLISTLVDGKYEVFPIPAVLCRKVVYRGSQRNRRSDSRR